MGLLRPFWWFRPVVLSVSVTWPAEGTVNEPQLSVAESWQDRAANLGRERGSGSSGWARLGRAGTRPSARGMGQPPGLGLCDTLQVCPQIQQGNTTYPPGMECGNIGDVPGVEQVLSHQGNESQRASWSGPEVMFGRHIQRWPQPFLRAAPTDGAAARWPCSQPSRPPARLTARPPGLSPVHLQSLFLPTSIRSLYLNGGHTKPASLPFAR